MKFSYVVGTRPNLVKLAALYPHLPGTIYHTGQHWGAMSNPFLYEYRLPQPLPLRELSGDVAIVFGDCRSTLEGADAAKKWGMRLAHVEAGLRCGDLTMEEERIRIEVDAMSDWLFAPSQDAVDNLRQEKVRGEVYLVGNVVMDTLTRYGLLTLHRPFNVDDHAKLRAIVEAVGASGLAFRWPVHPRVEPPIIEGVTIEPPLGRGLFIELLRGAVVVVTDSGGVQEEAAWLGRPCITVRPSTERPITLQYGNRLTDVAGLTEVIRAVVPQIPLWDSHAAERIAAILKAVTAT